jgi:signal transduction histidine kinase
MRLRIILLVVAISSMVLVSFMVPLALVLRTFAADRAVSTATVQAQWMAPLVATLDTSSLRLAVAQVNAESNSTPVTVFLPGGQQIGTAARRNASVMLASKGRSFTTQVPGGVEVLVAVQGLPAGTAVIRTFVPARELRHGVIRAWLLLCGVGLGLVVLSVAVADQLARSLVRPVTALARASDQLATGDLSARAQVAGPPEVRRASAGLNRLAVRIGELLTRERETVADLSHRLRTPLTALRIDVESLRNNDEMTQLINDVNAVERTVNEVIKAARRPTGEGAGVACEANHVTVERAAFWQPLAEDTDRRMTVELAAGPVVVHVSREDLAACVDILLENVFAHTPEGAAFAVRVSRRAGGGGWLVVADDGPGFAHADPRRGLSSGGSTGLGLDIARRIAEDSGGTLTIGRSPSGGGSVTVGLGAPAGPADRGRSHRRHPRLRREGRGGWLRRRRAGRQPVPAAGQARQLAAGGDGPGGYGRPPWRAAPDPGAAPASGHGPQTGA